LFFFIVCSLPFAWIGDKLLIEINQHAQYHEQLDAGDYKGSKGRAELRESLHDTGNNIIGIAFLTTLAFIPIVPISYKIFKVSAFMAMVGGAKLTFISDESKLGYYMNERDNYCYCVGIKPWGILNASLVPGFSNSSDSRNRNMKVHKTPPKKSLLARSKVIIGNRENGWRTDEFTFPFAILSWDDDYKCPVEKQAEKVRQNFERAVMQRKTLADPNYNPDTAPEDADYTLIEDKDSSVYNYGRG